MSNQQQQRLQAAADRVELGELLHRYAWAIDKWEWSLLDQVFTEDAEVDFSSVGQYVAGESVLRGRKAIVTWLRDSIKPFPDVLHFLSNQIVTLEGDEARITTYMQVLHLPMGGIYHSVAATRRGRLADSPLPARGAHLRRGRGTPAASHEVGCGSVIESARRLRRRADAGSHSQRAVSLSLRSAARSCAVLPASSVSSSAAKWASTFSCARSVT